MTGGRRPSDVKTTSVLRRLPAFPSLRYVKAPGLEGRVCAFQLLLNSSPVVVEAACGRAMKLLPGDLFLGTAETTINLDANFTCESFKNVSYYRPGLKQ